MSHLTNRKAAIDKVDSLYIVAPYIYLFAIADSQYQFLFYYLAFKAIAIAAAAAAIAADTASNIHIIGSVINEPNEVLSYL